MSATGRPRDPGRGAAGDAGATLIEMLVVVGILGLVSALIFPAWSGPLHRVQLYEARAALVGHLRDARAESIRHDAPVTLEIAEDGRGYAWGHSRTALPLGVVVVGAPRAITFSSDGSSSGGALKVSSRGRSLSVEVDPASGLTEAPPG